MRHLLLALLVLRPPAAVQGEPKKPDLIALKGGRIVTVSGGEIENGVVLMENGRIRKVGMGLEIPPEATVLEIPGTSQVLPGFIDLHSHLGSAFDVEESTESVTPQVKAVEAFTSQHRDVRAALASGVTTVALSPGNGNLVGGRVGLVKLNGARYDRALYRDAVAMKVSLGNEALRRDREPTSKTGAVRLLREMLREGRGDLRTLPLFVHAQSVGEIQSALELKDAFKVRMILLHAQASAETIERIRTSGVPVAFGPLTVNDRKDTLETPAKLDRAGVPLAFVSDAPATSEDQLRVSAAFAAKYGLDRGAALRALTTVPADILGLSKDLGSLEEGKEADLVVWSGDPLSLTSDVTLVLVGGKVTFKKQDKP